MTQHPMQEASIPNPVLEPFRPLIGTWNTTGTHRLIPDTILHGRASFEWVENGAFLLWRSEVDEPGIPSSLAMIGSDDSKGEYFMLYFDERGVSRKFDVSLQDKVWKMQRIYSGFSQRFNGTIAEGGNIILGVWELSEDDSTWKKDLELTFRRMK